MMTILVTGGAGFIGSNLVRLILGNTGHRVVNLDTLTYAGSLDSIRDLADDPRHVFERVDLCQPDKLRQVFEKHRPDAVMHLAAESHVDRSIHGPAAFVQSNIVGTYHLLEAALAHFRALPPAAQRAFRFLHVSTDEVYGSLAPDGEAFSEASRYSPNSPYSASKAAADHLVRAWHRTYGLPVVVTACSNNFGPWQYPEKLIPVVIARCLRGEPVPVYGSGMNVRDWIHVEDHCSALLTVLAKGVVGDTYNIGAGNELANLDLVKRICRTLDTLLSSARPHASLITFVGDRPGHDFRYAIDSSKIRAELGWQPRMAFDRALEETIRWYLENRLWWAGILDGGQS